MLALRETYFLFKLYQILFNKSNFWNILNSPVRKLEIYGFLLMPIVLTDMLVFSEIISKCTIIKSNMLFCVRNLSIFIEIKTCFSSLMWNIITKVEILGI